MTDQKQKKQDKKSGFNSSAAAVITGAVVGAGAAVVGMALNTQKNRDKVKDALTNVKEQAISYKDAVEEKLAEDK